MNKPAFAVDLHQQGEAVLLSLHGEIDIFAVQGLEQAYARASHSASALILDFSDVQYINSTGIGLLIELLGQARKKHKQLLGFGLNKHYQEIFEIVRLSDYIHIYPDRESALVSVSGRMAS